MSWLTRMAALAVLGGLLAPSARADARDDNAAAKNIGAVLAWRLGPEVIEERCRGADPAGAGVRRAALRTWQEKNATLIRSVDERIAEVVPLFSPSQPQEAAVAMVRSQIRDVLLERLAGKNPEEIAALCKSEADPANPRWNNGMPMVAVALAELYDWKVQNTAR